MKTLKNILLAMAFVVGYGSASASTIAKNDYRVAMNKTVQSFIDGVCNGEPAEFDKVIDDNAVISMLRGNRIVSFSKKEQLNELKHLAGTKQNCQTSYKITEDRENYAVVKVEMTYESFKKVTYLTMQYKGGNWGISQVSSVFE